MTIKKVENMKNQVYRVAIKRNEGNLQEIIYRAMDLIDWKKQIKKNGCVVVKPNMGNLTYVPGVITNPDVVYHVVSRLRDYVDDVIVGESDGIRYSCNEAFIKTGIRAAVEKAGGRILNFSEDKQVSVKIDGLYWKEVILPKSIVDADSFISIPLIKTHEATILTCGIKNQWGCIADRNRILHHHHIHQVLVDVNSAIQPNLVITDGTTCMEGNGPIHGFTKELNIIIASNNIVANDIVVAQLMKLTNMNIKHLDNAIAMDLGPKSIDEIELKGENLNNLNDLYLAPPNPDIVTNAMASIYRSKFLTKLVFVSPLFRVMNNMAWAYRGIRGKKKLVN